MELLGREWSLGGIRETWVDGDGNVTENLKSTRAVGDILDLNRKAMNGDNPISMMESIGRSEGTGHHLVARVPMWLVEKMWNERGVNLMNDDEALLSLLRDADYKWLKTTDEAL